MQRKTWKDLNAGQRAGIIVMGIIQFSLLISALLDIRRRNPAQIRGSKGLWTGFAFVNWIGPIAWFAYGRKRD